MKAALWQSVLPVLQDINDYGGNFISFFVSRAVIDEIDQLANGGDQAMERSSKDLRKRASSVKGPADHSGFNGFFECYHEALFYILASRRGVRLRPIPKGMKQTPDFETGEASAEAFEIKTIDFSGASYTYTRLMDEGLDRRVETAEKAKKSGIGVGYQRINPHGDAANTHEAINRVMRQVAQNVKEGQFQAAQTFLVVSLARTALRTESEELRKTRLDGPLGGKVSGHLWTIAAHESGDAFFDATLDDHAQDMGEIAQDGILRDFPFVAGIIFVGVTWNKLPSSDFAHPFPEKAFHLHGVWNGAYEPPVGVLKVDKNKSAFTKICDAVESIK